MNLNKFGRWSGIVVAVAMLAMVLQGCGGDNGNGISQDQQAMLKLLGELQAVELPDEEELTAATLMELVSQVMAVGDPADMASIEEGASLHAQINYHTGKVGELEDDIGEADGTTMAQDGDLYEQLRYYMGRLGTPSDEASNADGASLYAQLNYHMMRLGDATDAPSMEADASVYAQLNYYKKQDKDRKDKEARDTASKAATALIPILTGRALGDDPPAGAATPAMTATSGGMLSAKLTGYKMADDEAPDMISGWRGVVLKKGREVIWAYTDIDDATATPLGDVYNNTRPAGEMRQYYLDRNTGNDVMEGDISWASVTRDTDAYSQSSATVGDDTTVTITFAGMVGNVPGMFSCAAETACAVPARDATDKTVMAPTGDGAEMWRFTPTDPSGTVDVADADGHLVFGWWLSKNADGLPTGADVFAAAMGDKLTARAASGDANLGENLDGVAVYRGGAAGKYGLHSLGAEDSEAGHFTANAMLTANFDAAGDANENGVMLSGEITDFMTGAGARNWKVILKAMDTNAGTADVQSPENLAPIDGAVAEWDIGGNLKGVGEWDATYHGTEMETNHPMAVTGEFKASIGTVGSILGAFGASNE
jgi:hypothetical protein